MWDYNHKEIEKKRSQKWLDDKTFVADFASEKEPFYSLFMFFPVAFELRQKPFLWVEDLSSYDSIAELPFYIPFYGDHISLFPILASIAIFFYMKMTTGQQMATQAPIQEGMPDMAKMMKYMIYLSPIMMLFFFNNS